MQSWAVTRTFQLLLSAQPRAEWPKLKQWSDSYITDRFFLSRQEPSTQKARHAAGQHTHNNSVVHYTNFRFKPKLNLTNPFPFPPAQHYITIAARYD
jgi:hypothetical protein